MVYVKDKPCSLTFKEYELLKLLLHNTGIVVTREIILERVWGIDFEGESRTLDMHIRTLRQKLGDAGHDDPDRAERRLYDRIGGMR